ncbi:serine protease, S1-C subfamily, contains C-terminal PDZ domain [Puniceibacterium sediminis]|uniref:Serine protease, S1-C subfamily, contains C-terminal PDZ domain n=2 Tax=Puniceibacterium sediminis TaxID=1608407 RepID=A0A238X8F7_9RHOB|nr:serine protease, S1-C subfamily, contains C-terminal PDZ domain [Puniceibacterium sediminis]
MVMALLAAVFLTAGAALAQDATYIQIEAQPTLTRAEERARDYTSYLRDVNGFALGNGWYGIALGPYDRAEAEARLRQLRGQGQIPQDSYIADTGVFRGQFWPIGAASQTAEQITTTDITVTPLDQVPEITAPSATVAAEQSFPDETPREAAAAEARLNGEAREQLQIALRWAGYYNSTIDGAFGPGTRNSMAEWQRANGYEATGVLTTRQRADLLGQYNAVLDGLDMRQVTEAQAGISILLPMGVVAFDRYESPFVHYGPTGELPVRVLLISQPGDQNTLFGLYEIMQTLEIVPPEGARERRRDGFTLTGANSRIVSHTEVRLENGQIKGFTLVWPAGDDARFNRVLQAMRSSFETMPGVLDSGLSEDTEPSVDLLAGLRIRQPKVTASGFFIDSAGTVVTARDAVIRCGRITLEDQYDAHIVAEDAATGVAVLRSDVTLAPQSVAALRTDLPPLQSEVAVSGYSFGGVLSAPTLTFGTLEDVRGLAGEETKKRLALASLPGDAGGPVMDAGGAVLGMLLPRDDRNRQLPEEVSFAAKADDIQALLNRVALRATTTQGGAAIAPEDLTTIALGMTVLVSCWE